MADRSRPTRRGRSATRQQHLEAVGGVLAADPAAERLHDGARLGQVAARAARPPAWARPARPRETRTRRCPPSWPWKTIRTAPVPRRTTSASSRSSDVLDRAGGVGQGEVALGGRASASRSRAASRSAQRWASWVARSTRGSSAPSTSEAARARAATSSPATASTSSTPARPRAAVSRASVGHVVAQGQVLELETQAGQRGAQHVRGVLGEVALAAHPVLQLAGAGRAAPGRSPGPRGSGSAAGRGRSGRDRAPRRRRRAAGTARRAPGTIRKPDHAGQRPRSAGTAPRPSRGRGRGCRGPPSGTG